MIIGAYRPRSSWTPTGVEEVGAGSGAVNSYTYLVPERSGPGQAGHAVGGVAQPDPVPVDRGVGGAGCPGTPAGSPRHWPGPAAGRVPSYAQVDTVRPPRSRLTGLATKVFSTRRWLGDGRAGPGRRVRRHTRLPAPVWCMPPRWRWRRWRIRRGGCCVARAGGSRGAFHGGVVAINDQAASLLVFLDASPAARQGFPLSSVNGSGRSMPPLPIPGREQGADHQDHGDPERQGFRRPSAATSTSPCRTRCPTSSVLSLTLSCPPRRGGRTGPLSNG